MTAEILAEAPDDSETVLISWLSSLYTAGHVANTRTSGGPLPFVLVIHINTEECVEESYANALVEVNVLTHKTAGEIGSRNEADKVHRRMLQQARFLEDVDLAGGRKASVESVSVFSAFRRAEYPDDLILRRYARYTIGLSYAEAQ